MSIKEILEQQWFTNVPIIKQDSKWRIIYFKSEDTEYERYYDGQWHLIYERTPTSELKKQFNIKWDKLYQYKDWYEERYKYRDKKIWDIDWEWKRILVTKSLLVKRYDNKWVIRKMKYDNRWNIIYVLEQWPDWFIIETYTKYDKKNRMTECRSTNFRETRVYDKLWNCIDYQNADWEFKTEEYNKKTRTAVIRETNKPDQIIRYNRKREPVETIMWDYHYIKEWALELTINGEEYSLNWIVLEKWQK